MEGAAAAPCAAQTLCCDTVEKHQQLLAARSDPWAVVAALQ